MGGILGDGRKGGPREALVIEDEFQKTRVSQNKGPPT